MLKPQLDLSKANIAPVSSPILKWRKWVAHSGDAGIVLPIFVLAHVISPSPSRVREHGVCFDDELELFLVSALQTQSKDERT
jgi:hypothetical protein